MLPFLFWMFTSLDNATEESQCDEQTENWSGFSSIFQLFLSMAGLVFLLKQKRIFTRLWLQLDRNCVSVFCPAFSKREKLLKWASGRLPLTWSSSTRTLAGGVSDLWSDGSLLCTLINSVIPGACPNPHRHWRKPPLHAQAIAYKYLGVIPVFTEKDLSSSLTVDLERSFLHYLNELQQSVIKLTDKGSQNQHFSLQYIARGMGLYSGEQHRKTIFYVYPNIKENTEQTHSNVIIHIRGPYGTYGKGIIPKFHNDLCSTPEINVISDLASKKTLGNPLKQKPSFIKSFTLPFMKYHKKHTGDNIEVEVTLEDDRARITYVPKNYGMYEINLISNGELLTGCPFYVHIFNNTSGVEDSLESGENIEEKSYSKRRIISKTIDFIDEQLPYSEFVNKYIILENFNNNKKNLDIESGSLKPTFNSEEVVDVKIKNGSVWNTKCSSCSKNEILNKTDDSICANGKNNNTCEMINVSNEFDTYNVNFSTRKIEREEEDDLVSDNIKINYNDLNENKNMLKVREEKKQRCFTTISTDTSPNEQPNFSKQQNFGSMSEHIKLQFGKNQDTIRQEIYENMKNIDSSYSATVHNLHSENNILTSTNLSLNKETIESTQMGNDSKIIDVNKLEFKGDNDINNCSTNLLDNDFSREHNKLKNKTSLVRNFDTKYFKNECNLHNKKEHAKYEDTEKDTKLNISGSESYPVVSVLNNCLIEDLNNNRRDYPEQNDVKQNLVKALTRRNSVVEVEKINIIPSRFFRSPEIPHNISLPISLPLETPNSTSPICSDHIAPEVERAFKKMSSTEKRKIFAGSTNSPFSKSENAEGSKNQRHFQFEGLSVLNVLDSLKESQGSSNASFSISTTSLPDMSSIDDEEKIFKSSVKDRKNFWEQVCSKKEEMTSRVKLNNLKERGRKKVIVNETKPSPEIEQTIKVTRKFQIYKSADDILSINECPPHKAPKKYKSMDNSLDDCVMLSIEERKRQLLKQNYEKERTNKQQITSKWTLNKNYKRKNNNTEVIEKPNFVKNNEIEKFVPVLDRIKKYDSVSKLSITKEENIKDFKTHKTINNPTKDMISNYIHNDLQESSPSLKTVKSHFKKAFKYFQNLEENAIGKTKRKMTKHDCRIYSLDIKNSKRRTKKKGGSLNLPNISERFSITNLYDDVFGNRKSSFKGAANRSAVVEALATFSRVEHSQNFKHDDEDDIRYDIFKKKAKTKKRRSIRSIFDVYY